MADAAFHIELRGLAGLTKGLEKYPEISRPLLRRAFDATEAVLAKNTLKNDPIPWKTGNLLMSFRFQPGDLMARWFPTANYAPHVEFGTAPHRIYPKTKRALAWKMQSAGGYVTSKSGRRYYKGGKVTGEVVVAYVDHPGTRPKPFMGEIVSKSGPGVERVFTEATDLITAEIARTT